jgi:hypothetical protein
MPDVAGFGRQLFASVFSDDPAPDVHAVVVVAHPGDESRGASWLLARMQPRASVFCLTGEPQSCPAGVSLAPPAAVQVLRPGPFSDAHFSSEVEELVWLTAAAASMSRPRVLVTHMCEGENLDHDVTAFAVHMTARLLTSGGLPPLVIEFPGRQDGSDPVHTDASRHLAAEHAVRIEFGPESRKLKRRLLRTQGDGAALAGELLRSECYLLARSGNPAEVLSESHDAYLDAPWCTPTRLRSVTRSVASALGSAILMPSARV